jgi:hypothetical protein
MFNDTVKDMLKDRWYDQTTMLRKLCLSANIVGLQQDLPINIAGYAASLYE